jgi:hypothetical protein
MGGYTYSMLYRQHSMFLLPDDLSENISYKGGYRLSSRCLCMSCVSTLTQTLSQTGEEKGEGVYSDLPVQAAHYDGSIRSGVARASSYRGHLSSIGSSFGNS